MVSHANHCISSLLSLIGLSHHRIVEVTASLMETILIDGLGWPKSKGGGKGIVTHQSCELKNIVANTRHFSHCINFSPIGYTFLGHVCVIHASLLVYLNIQRSSLPAL